MAIQMIFCVETSKRADTDSIYIRETLNHLYVIDNQTKISIVNMNSKSRYNSKDVLKEIVSKTKDYILGETKVIYCIDTDDYEKNADHKKELDDIRHFCKDCKYELIWFCHDVEEVFIGGKVPDSQKVREAGAFRRMGKIKELDFSKLSFSVKRKHSSNMLIVLDKYLSRK